MLTQFVMIHWGYPRRLRGRVFVNSFHTFRHKLRRKVTPWCSYGFSSIYRRNMPMHSPCCFFICIDLVESVFWNMTTVYRWCWNILCIRDFFVYILLVNWRYLYEFLWNSIYFIIRSYFLIMNIFSQLKRELNENI